MNMVWITGAKGFIGRHLARQLAQDGTMVAGIGHGAWPDELAQQWGVSCWLNGDVSQSNLNQLAVQTGLPDAVFHVAGGSSVGPSLRAPQEDFRRTVESTMQLLEWLRHHAPHTRIVLASSAAVYGAHYQQPIQESDPLQPYSPYGYHKRMAELACESYARSFGLRTAIVRLFSVYGPELRKQLLWDLCQRLNQQPPTLQLAGSGDEMRDWVHVRDAVTYLIQAAEHASDTGFVVNGGTGIGVTVRDVATAICAAWGGATSVTFSGTHRPGDPQYLVADTTVVSEMVQSPVVDWRQGVHDYVAWFQQIDHTEEPRP